MIKLIICDIDGTLCNDKKEILSSTIDIFKKCQQHNIQIAIASGRDFMDIQPVLDQLKEVQINYVISLNGGYTKDLMTDKDYSCPYLSKDIIQRLIDFMKDPAIRFWLVEGEATYCYAKRFYYLLETYHAIQRKLTLTLNPKLPLRQFHMISNVKQIKHEYRKAVYEAHPKVLEKIYDDLQNAFGNELEIFYSQKDAIDMMPRGINKGYGVKQLMNLLDLKEDEVMCFGDSENDISMFEAVKYGIAMENAQNIVKEKAFYITSSNNEDGIQKAIEHFISL